MATLLKPSEFATVKGVSKPTVHEAMKSRIAGAVVIVDGRRMIDREQGLELWDKNTKRNNNAKTGLPQDRRERAPKAAPPSKPPTDQELQAFIQGLPEDQIPDLNDSRARREHYQAEVSKLAALQGRGELVVGAEVERKAFELGRAVRDQMTGIPDRVSGMLAACGDARKVHQVLSEEIRIALGALTNG